MVEQRVIQLVIDAAAARTGQQQLSNAIRGLTVTTNQADASTRTLEASQQRLGRSSSGLANQLRGLVGVLAAYVGVRQSLGTLIAFDKSIQTITAITEASEIQIETISEYAQQLGATTQFTAAQSADALAQLSRAGLSVNQAIQASRGVLNLATAETLDFGQASDLVVNTLAQFGLAASDATRVTDVLVQTSRNAVTTATELGGALRFAGQFARGLELDVETVVASLGVLATSGIRSRLGGTQFRAIVNSLVDPTREARQILTAYGVSLDDIDIRARGLIDVLKTLRDANIPFEEYSNIFRREAAGGAGALIRMVDKLEEFVELNRQADGVAQQFADTVFDSLFGSLLALLSAFQGLIIRIGRNGGFIDALRGVLDAARNTVLAFSGMEQVIEDNVIVYRVAASGLKGMLIAFVAIHTALIAVTLATRAWAAALALTPIGAITLSLGLLLAAYNLIKDEQIELGKRTVSLGSIMGATFDKIGEQANVIGKTLEGVFKNQITASESLLTVVGDNIEFFIGITTDKIVEFAQGIETAGRVLLTIVRGISVAAVTSVVEAFQRVERVLTAGQRAITERSIASVAALTLALTSASNIETLAQASTQAFSTAMAAGLADLPEQGEATGQQIAEALYEGFAVGVTQYSGLSRDAVDEVFKPQNIVDSILQRAEARIRKEEALARQLREALIPSGDDEPIGGRTLEFEEAENGYQGLIGAATQYYRQLEDEIQLTIRYAGDLDALREQRERARELTQFQTYIEQEFGAETQESIELTKQYTAALDRLIQVRRASVGLAELQEINLELEQQTKNLIASNVERRNAAQLVEVLSALEKIHGTDVEALNAEYSAFVDRLRELEILQRTADLLDQVGKSATEAFVDIAFDIHNARDALEDFARSLSRLAVQKLFTEPVGDLLSGFLRSTFLQSAKGNVFNQGNLIPFAQGGIISSPTLFPLGNRGVGIAGESGAEAIVPLARTPSGDLGIKGGITITVNVAPVPGMDARKTGAQIARQIRNELQRL